jgi:hypothetical protein
MYSQASAALPLGLSMKGMASISGTTAIRSIVSAFGRFQICSAIGSPAETAVVARA